MFYLECYFISIIDPDHTCEGDIKTGMGQDIYTTKPLAGKIFK